MKNYVLFVDTETSGLPKDWKKPYSASGVWPSILQIAWIIYTREGKPIKTENHFIHDPTYQISPSSEKIHGITREFLEEHGERRKKVMRLLFKDLQQYRPLVVGYFMKLDFHMLSAGFYRSGLTNPLKKLPTFCLMKVTAPYCRVPSRQYLRLDELYLYLFHRPLQHHHDAMADAQATAQCFFTLEKKGDIDRNKIVSQQSVEKETKKMFPQGVILPVCIVLFLLMLIMLYLL